MKLPGDTGMQGIDIEQLEINEDITLEKAIEIADELGAEMAYYNPDDNYADIDSDFVVNAIDFRVDNVFLLDHEDDRLQGINQVVSTNQFSRGFSTAAPNMDQNERARSKNTDWPEYATSYGELFQLWLQGRIIPLKTETTYTRTDTGEEVEV